MALLKPTFQASALIEKSSFRQALGSWFSKNGKDYPWRRTREPYAILVSEVMLQQTRIATVLGKNYYTSFLEKFPNVETLAQADDQQLLKAWEGLGYYRRARMLRDAAKKIHETHGGVFPENKPELLTLPGIGPYTAAALMSFAFGKPSALVDGNVSRVLSRLMDSSVPIDSAAGIKLHREWARELCDPEQPARHNQAIMELGQTHCHTGNPDCHACPVARFCKTRSPEHLPVKKARAKLTQITENAIWTRDHQQRILLHHESGSRRTGLWKLPLRDKSEIPANSLLFEQSYHITRYRVQLRVHSANNSAPKNGDQWIPPEQLETLPIAAPFLKAIKRLLSDF